jgi:hypothetical protein
MQRLRHIGTPARVAATAAAAIFLAFAGMAGSGTWNGNPNGPWGPPSNTSLPTITGVAQVGQTLTGNPGSWTGRALSFTYQWLRCDSSGNQCNPISNASSTTYSPVAADVGLALRFSVTASNKRGAVTATSDPTAQVLAAPAPPPPPPPTPPSVTSAPQVSGTAQAGSTLSGSTGSWSGTTPMSYAYAWKRCDSSGNSCTAISGATAAAYAVASADVGHTLRVSVTATNTAGSSSASSAQTPVVTSASSSSSSYGDLAGLDAYKTGDFATIAALGIKRVRMDNPSASTITTAASYGITVLPIADYEPWPDLNGGLGDKYPPLPQYYTTWADRMIAQWKPLPNPPEAIEVWNEPWLTSFWKPTPDPVAYLNLVKTFATEAWKVWPNVKILVSADSVGSTNTFGDVLWRSHLLAADTTGFLSDPRVQPTTHNYVEGRTPTTVTSQPCWWDLNRFQCAYNDFKAHGNPDPQVWVTEYGWESGVVGETNQASYTTQALQIFQSSGMVAHAYCFFLKTGDTWDYNWLRSDGTQKPVAAAVQQLITG